MPYSTFNAAVDAKVQYQRAGWICGPVKGDRTTGYYFTYRKNL